MHIPPKQKLTASQTTDPYIAKQESSNTIPFPKAEQNGTNATTTPNSRTHLYTLIYQLS